MDTSNLITLVATPLIAAVSAILVAILQRGPAKQSALQESAEKARELDIADDAADNARIGILMEAQNNQLQHLEAENNKLTTRLDAQDEVIRKLQTHTHDLEVRQFVYLAHIERLEGLIPNPPGVPPRPWS